MPTPKTQVERLSCNLQPWAPRPRRSSLRPPPSDVARSAMEHRSSHQVQVVFSIAHHLGVDTQPRFYNDSAKLAQEEADERPERPGRSLGHDVQDYVVDYQGHDRAFRGVRI